MLILHPERLRGGKTGQQSPAEGHRALPAVPQRTVRPLQRLGPGSEFQRVISSQGTQPGVTGRLRGAIKAFDKARFALLPFLNTSPTPGWMLRSSEELAEPEGQSEMEIH